MARPIEYKEEYILKTQEYLDSCEDEYSEFHSTRGEKTDGYQRLIRVNIPTIEGLSLFLNVNRDTLYDWESKYPEFSDILGRVRVKQAEMLIKNGLSGDYNPTISKLLLTKHGYTDKTELTGKDGKDLMPTPILPLNVIPADNSDK